MALLQDLIKQVDDPDLRERILREVDKMSKQKKFGLVFEEHLPECTPLYDVKIKRGSKVSLKAGKVDDIYIVQSINGDNATCEHRQDHHMEELALVDLVAIAEFGEPIYPYLKPIDSICNAPDSDLWHTLIEADNYHALQLLEYLYAEKVDCIYIDPPYNTGARDWKYNNDYVDSSDQYRHSKWLSFMEKRLKLAKKLLNPKDSVLIVTIDEKEYLHLGCLIEELFSDCSVQMISSVINPKGNRRDNQFSRCEEYIFFIFLGASAITSNGTDMLRQSNDVQKADRTVRLRGLLRQASNHGRRVDRPNLFYPLLFDETTGKFLGHGPVLARNENREEYVPPAGQVAMWPIASNGTELTWNLQPDTLMEKFNNHFLSFGKWNGTGRTGYYLSAGQEKNFKKGLYDVVGIDEDGAYKIELKTDAQKVVRPLTVWNKKEHSASEYGTSLLNEIIGSGKFSFPKSLYAVRDTLGFVVQNKPNALIVDFFSGSGTTLHAVNLLNAEDGGHRRCIMVTNNEVSDSEAKSLTKQGYKPGDEEWEKLGIARYVTWPRTVCTIEGHDVNGKPLKGNYFGSDMPMADGFKSNAAYFKLGFLDKNAVALGRQFKELLPVLWMKANCIGPCPQLESDELPKMLMLPDNKFAVLIDETYYSEFDAKLMEHPEIQTIYIITDSESAYREMIRSYEGKDCYQLYRDYIDNFRINTGR